MFYKSINKSNYHLFVIKVDNRDDLMNFLQKNGIKCAIHYPQPFYDTQAYKHIKVYNCDTICSSMWHWFIKALYFGVIFF